MKVKSLKLKIKNYSLKFKVFIFLFLTLNFACLTGRQVLLPFNLSEVNAQTFSLGISPPILEVMMKPGKTITQVYKLTNQGADSQIYVNIVAFEPADELGNTELKLNNQLLPVNEQQFLSWFSFQNADINLPGGFLVKAGKTQELVLKIKVPENAEEKDYYSALIFQVKPSEGMISTSGAQTSGILASNILLTVSKSGRPPKSGKIVEFSTKKFSIGNWQLAIFDSFDTIPFSLRVANTGRTLFKPLGSVKIISPLGKEVEFLEILPQNILAHSQRKLYLKGTSPQSPLKEISWQPRGLKIGKYKAKVEIILSNSDKKLTDQISFIIFPWKIILGLIIVLTLLSTLSHRVGVRLWTPRKK